MKSATVCRRPSRDTMIVQEPAPSMPSSFSMTPSAFWSTPRPPAENVTGSPTIRLTVRVPSGPKPCPTVLMMIVAIPWAASEATVFTACLLPPLPWPKIATGQPPTGLGPDGRYRLK
jgi:hypothetical protein